MEKDEIIFMVLIVIMLGGFYALASQSNHNKQVVEKAEACEKSGGVYVDNMRRVGKNTDHNYMCMNKNMFIFPEGEK